MNINQVVNSKKMVGFAYSNSGFANAGGMGTPYLTNPYQQPAGYVPPKPKPKPQSSGLFGISLGTNETQPKPRTTTGGSVGTPTTTPATSGTGGIWDFVPVGSAGFPLSSWDNLQSQGYTTFRVRNIFKIIQYNKPLNVVPPTIYDIPRGALVKGYGVQDTTTGAVSWYIYVPVTQSSSFVETLVIFISDKQFGYLFENL